MKRSGIAKRRSRNERPSGYEAAGRDHRRPRRAAHLCVSHGHRPPLPQGGRHLSPRPRADRRMAETLRNRRGPRRLGLARRPRRRGVLPRLFGSPVSAGRQEPDPPGQIGAGRHRGRQGPLFLERVLPRRPQGARRRGSRGHPGRPRSFHGQVLVLQRQGHRQGSRRRTGADARRFEASPEPGGGGRALQGGGWRGTREPADVCRHALRQDGDVAPVREGTGRPLRRGRFRQGGRGARMAEHGPWFHGLPQRIRLSFPEGPRRQVHPRHRRTGGRPQGGAFRDAPGPSGRLDQAAPRADFRESDRPSRH